MRHYDGCGCAQCVAPLHTRIREFESQLAEACLRGQARWLTR